VTGGMQGVCVGGAWVADGGYKEGVAFLDSRLGHGEGGKDGGCAG